MRSIVAATTSTLRKSLPLRSKREPHSQEYVHKKHRNSTYNKVWRCKPNRQHQAKSCTISKMAWPGPVSKKHSPLATIKMEISQRCILSFFHVLLQILIRSPPCFFYGFYSTTKPAQRPLSFCGNKSSFLDQVQIRVSKITWNFKQKKKKKKRKVYCVHSCLVKVQSRMHKVKHLAANVEAMVHQQQHLLWLLVTGC